MPKKYHFFISHSWSYDVAYERLVDLLNKTGLDYSNYSVPKNDPIHTRGTDKELTAAIDAQIKPCSCVIILAGVYATYSKWINKEIELAVKCGKPIVAVEPWGSERTSKVVKDNADVIIGWSSAALKKAIIEYSL